MLLAAAALASACSDQDEIDAESAAILARMPRGSPFSLAVKQIHELGFTCNFGQLEYLDRSGHMQKAPAHLRCLREEAFLLACTRRTNAILVQRDGRLINVLVNVGRFCGPL